MAKRMQRQCYFCDAGPPSCRVLKRVATQLVRRFADGANWRFQAVKGVVLSAEPEARSKAVSGRPPLSSRSLHILCVLSCVSGNTAANNSAAFHRFIGSLGLCSFSHLTRLQPTPRQKTSSLKRLYFPTPRFPNPLKYPLGAGGGRSGRRLRT